MRYGKPRVYINSLGHAYAVRKVDDVKESYYQLLFLVGDQWGWLGTAECGGKKGLYHFVAGDPATLTLASDFSPSPLPTQYKPWSELPGAEVV
jgi:hypothetical protein